MAAIIERVFTGGYEGTFRGLQLGKEEYIRRMSVGSDWSKLRIVALVSIEHTDDIPGILDIGVCSGTAGGIGSGSPINYVGAGFGGGNASRLGTPLVKHSTSAGWAYSYTSSNSGANYLGWHCQAQQGATISGYSRISGYFGSMYHPTGTLVGGPYRRGLIMVDMRRTTDTTCRFGFNVALASNGAYIDYDYGAMIYASENQFFTDDGASRYHVGYNQATAALVSSDRTFVEPTNLTYSTAAGPLDCVNVAWNLNSNYCLLWGLAVSRQG